MTDVVVQNPVSPAAGASPSNDPRQILEALRSTQPGCSLAGFGDLQARLVLRCVPQGARAQEELDELCSQAAESFACQDGYWATETSTASKDPVEEALILCGREIRMFLRVRAGTGAAGQASGGARPEDALLLVLESQHVVEHIRASAHQAVLALAQPLPQPSEAAQTGR